MGMWYPSAPENHGSLPGSGQENPKLYVQLSKLLSIIKSSMHVFFLVQNSRLQDKGAIL